MRKMADDLEAELEDRDDSGSPVPTSDDGELELKLQEPLPGSSVTASLPSSFRRSVSPTPVSTFPFFCRCGAQGVGRDLGDGLDVVKCKECKRWSHVPCQQYARASNLGTKPFICDFCRPQTVAASLPRPISPPHRTRQNHSKIQFLPGRGALARHGKYWYPVRLLARSSFSAGWRVQWWHGCEFSKSSLPPTADALVSESCLVDALWKNQGERRKIRLGKFKHAHEFPVEEGILAYFQTIAYTEDIGGILAPHVQILTSIFTQPHQENSEIPAVAYAIKKKKKFLPYAGDLPLIEQAKIMNWFYHYIPLAKGTETDWVSSPSHAHAITIVLAARHSEELKAEATEEKWLWEAAWQLQCRRERVVTVDVDRECLSLLEEHMFECSTEAGPAGDHQWGLDAGAHQGQWDPYSGLPFSPLEYRELEETRGANFSEGSESESDNKAAVALKNRKPTPKPRAKML
ncbi:hypothetical protein C8J57DRAFT_749943 [Mycena rebaudengoi]|nr:hypothetical protein C8J57DRAFT_749943 [Mycena rebaudengoi]